MMNTKISPWRTWFSQNILLVLCGFLLAFLPLYPKLPLFDIIPGYIVRVRLEDFFIFFTILVWLYHVYKKKISWKTPLTPLIAAYALAGLLSTVSAVFITKTVPFEPLHVIKTLLHYLRYLEYFSLFFIAYSAVRTKKNIKILFTVFTLTLLGVFIYGVGQKHLYWPVYSTMNREFSKGMRLILTEHARVQSTFAGHYDLGAYLVIVLPLLAAGAFFSKRKIEKTIIWLVFVAGLWLLMLTASRSSLLGYGAGMAVAIVLGALLQNKIKQKIGWLVSRSVWVGLISLVMLATFGTSMFERLLQSLEAFPMAYKTYTDLQEHRKYFLAETLPEILGRDDLPTIQLQVEVPDNSISIDEVNKANNVLVASDEQPIPARPSDVKVEIPDVKRVATVSADGTVQITNVEVPRVYTDTALQHGLSAAIRYDTLWPRAIQGFYTNPLLGSGYATLTKDTIYHFTEAESTDNNYLRILGETGLAGFISFFGAIAIGLWLSIKALLANKTASDPQLIKLLAIGFIAATVGLLANAIYIDVFAASKVAQIYWALTGIVLASYGFLLKNNPQTPQKTYSRGKK